MTYTASRLDLPATLNALVLHDTVEPIDAPEGVERAVRALSRDGAEVEIWVGTPGDTRLSSLWRRLGWLQGRTTARRPVAFDVLDGVEALITEPLRGRSALEVEYRVDAVRTIGTVGAALAALHRTGIDRCPFVIDTARLAADAQDRLATTDPSTPLPDPAVAHVSPARLAAVIGEGLDRFGATDGPVLCHGHPTVDRFVLHDGAAVGFDGWDRCGAGDRYLDLAVLARSVATTLTPHLVPVLFDAYGLERPDLARLDWFQLIDAAS